MEPKSPIKPRDSRKTLLPTILYPLETEDCFELAYEADEFGVHHRIIQTTSKVKDRRNCAGPEISFLGASGVVLNDQRLLRGIGDGGSEGIIWA
jgi:hypothetical protein